MPSMNDTKQKRAGVAYGLAAFLSWGVLPLYFKAVDSVPPLEVLAHRVVWSLAFLLVLTMARGGWTGFVALFRSRRTQLTLMTTTVLIATNWGIFIWAVVNGQLVEASLGYFITPLINVVLGFLFLRERLRPLQLVAVALAACGIIWMTANLGHPPMISMTLAVSFGFYGLLRKQVPASGIQGLTAETLMLSPVAIGWMVWRYRQGELVFMQGPAERDLLLLAAGVITALPLIWFAESARRLRLATMGFLQYLAPSGQLLALYTADTARGMRRVPAGPTDA